jgi:hypothetical protein
MGAYGPLARGERVTDESRLFLPIPDRPHELISAEERLGVAVARQ